jgi:hypothetical protein
MADDASKTNVTFLEEKTAKPTLLAYRREKAALPASEADSGLGAPGMAAGCLTWCVWRAMTF